MKTIKSVCLCTLFVLPVWWCAYGQDMDFGDAGPPYPTLAASGGASHLIVSGINLGIGVDADQDGQPDPNALGDDNDGNDDEDGVLFTSLLTPGQLASVDVVASISGLLNAWIDFGGDRSWATPGDQIFVNQALGAGVNHLAFQVPASAVAGKTVARFRFSTQADLLPDGGPAPDGEVEDHQVTIEQGEPDKDYGDAPEGALAYPSMGVTGLFPTCKGVLLSGYVEHGLCWGHFGPGFDFEGEGNAGLCPLFNPNSYDQDECSSDGDAGLLFPDALTITGPVGSEVVTACVQGATGLIGASCATAVWGTDLDIWVTNGMPVDAYVNVLMDWNQDGQWNGSSSCPQGSAPEHVLVDFVVPMGYGGPLSGLHPPSFTIGPNPGPVWTRFSIMERSVQSDWDGSGQFEDGETEDYLLRVGEQVTVPELKWVQWPDCDVGVDVASWRLNEGPSETGPTVADDWLCDGRPVNGLTWWGSYIGWLEDEPSTNVAPPDPMERPLGFFVTWYTDVPTNGTAFSHPGAVLFTNYYPLEEFGQPVVVPGLVYEESWCVSTLDFMGPGLWEHEFVYHLDLPEEDAWLEKEGRVYWVSIEAVYPAPPTAFPWGWKTTEPPWHWNDDAVSHSGSGWEPMVYPPPGWPAGHPYDGETVDMAFALRTDITPARCKKWEQPPDMVEGEDMLSTEFAGMPHRADDFVSDGRPITDIHWWGSYIGWETQIEGSETNPVPPPFGANHPLGFNLSWHAHSTEDPCLPGPLLTNIFVNITNCYETYYGSVFQYWKEPPGYEHEYQYYVDLIDPDIAEGGAWLETNGGHYWLDIVAVFPGNFDPGAVHNGWGWKITPAVTNCSSVYAPGGIPPWLRDGLPPLHPREGAPFDLAFELTTTEPPTNFPIVFTNVYGPVWGRHMLVSQGHCGCGKQVLQWCTNLVHGEAGWSDLATNAHPRYENHWLVDPNLPLKCYRIRATK